MAIIKNGILGGFSGKAGAVVGYQSGGKSFMRGKPRVRTSPPTPKELINREKFAYIQAWLQPLLEFLRVGFQDYAPNFQGFAAAKSYNSKNALIGISPYFQINPAWALVSFGDMSQATKATAVTESGNVISFSWTGGDFVYDDRAMLLAYDMTGEKAKFNTAAERADGGHAKLKLDETFTGKQVDVYLAFVSEDRKRRSSSQYLGLVTVL
nr:DUF6266 family protein [Pedobacter panaciterrae]